MPRMLGAGRALLALVLVLGVNLPAAAADADKDGLRDGFEVKYGVTDPQRRDSDGDGVIDSAEDHDGDRLSDLGEQRFGTHPGRRDTDGDGRSDGREDKDGNGRSNASEQDRRPLPLRLRPSLAAAAKDFSPYRSQCQTWQGSAAITKCHMGPAGSDTTIVLLGDSHATTYLSAMEPTILEQGWRLVTMLKSGCPPLLGVHSANNIPIDAGRSCRQWRRNLLDRLAANPPDHIIIGHSDAYSLRRLDGRAISRSQRPAVWRDGLKKTLAALPASSKIIVLGDVPDNHGNPVRCLRKHKEDLSACVTARQSRAERTIEMALRQAASRKGASFRTLYGKICSYDPCPLVQGNILIWRDEDHLSETFLKRLEPAMRSILLGEIGASAAGRRR